MKKTLTPLYALAFLFLVYSSALAEWGLYGNARVGTWYTAQDEDLSSSGDDDVDFDQNLHSNARIGANVVASDEIGGRFEYGTSNGSANIRLLYGMWNFGKGTLLVGQNYTPIECHMISAITYKDDGALLSVGIPYESRLPMVQIKMGNLTLAAVQPYNVNALGVTERDIDTYIPKLEAAYNVKADNINITLFGGTNIFKVEDENEHNYEIYSGIAGVRALATIDALYINGCLFGALNAGDYGFRFDGGADHSEIKDGDVENSTTFGGTGVMGYKLSDKMVVEGGASYVQHDVDSAKDPDGTMLLYAQVRLFPHPSVCIVPEIGYIDYMDDASGADEGALMYAGAKWQINF